MKKIAIITINYNNSKGLERTIKSVIKQINCEFEFVVIDGNSDDNSLEIINTYSNKINYWISEPDNGIYHAQNKGWQNSKAEYCLFLNSGDELANQNVLSEIEKELNNTDIVYGDLFIRLTNDEVKKLISPNHLDVHYFMVSTLWHPTAFISRRVLEMFGGYNETFKITGDYEFFIRTIIKNQVSTKHVPKFISVFYLDGISNNKAADAFQLEERKRSWSLNFSDRVIEMFEKYTSLLRSREYKIGKLISNIKRIAGK